jgi:hypothetical protein
LRDHKLYAKFSKCEFWLKSVKFFTNHKSLKYIFTQSELNMRQ